MNKKRLFKDFSSEAFKRVFVESSSIKDALERMGYSPASTTYVRFRERCAEEGLDISSLLEKAKHTREQSLGKYRIDNLIPWNEVLVEHSTYDRKTLKKRLISEGLLKNVCSICGLLPLWNDRCLVLVLDHINGVPDDNRIDNLRLLCPNCNSQEETFCGANKRKKQPNVCVDCGTEITRGAVRCAPCSKLERVAIYKLPVTERPTAEKIKSLKQSMGWKEIGDLYNVSGNTIKQWVIAETGTLEGFADLRKIAPVV